MAIPSEMTVGNRMQRWSPRSAGVYRKPGSYKATMSAPEPIDLGHVTFSCNAARMDNVNERAAGEPGV